MKNNSYSIFIAVVVSLGGFLFGFDAGIISGVVDYAAPNLNITDDNAIGWVVSAPSFASMFAMLVAGILSDFIGRKRVLLGVAFLYAVSALLSAIADSYTMLWIARMIGGVAFGAALIIAPTYIAEISNKRNRGMLVSIQQLNIVLGFFGAFVSNYFFNHAFKEGSTWLTEDNIWRWMLGVELIPAVLYFLLLFFVPKSPRWLFTKDRAEEGKSVINKIHGEHMSYEIIESIETSIQDQKSQGKAKMSDVLTKGLSFIFIVGLVIGILQQVTGINAVYFYATSIFKQTGIGTNNAFFEGVLLSIISVVFTIISMFFIDRLGRRPLFLIGIAGVAVSMLLCGYGFHTATYKITPETIGIIDNAHDAELLNQYVNKEFTSDVEFKNAMKKAIGPQEYGKQEGNIMQAATHMNASLVLIGIFGFIASFAISLGPVMWVMLSEMYPNKIRGLVIGIVGLVNSFASWVVQQVFPWELNNLGNANTFFIFGAMAVVGFIALIFILPETKGKSLEELEKELAA